MSIYFGKKNMLLYLFDNNNNNGNDTDMKYYSILFMTIYFGKTCISL